MGQLASYSRSFVNLFCVWSQSIFCLFVFTPFQKSISRDSLSAQAIPPGWGAGGGRFSSVSFLAEEAENCEFLYIKKNTHPLDTLKNRRTFIFVMSEAHNQLLWLWTSSRPKISVKTDLKGGTQFGLNRERGFWFSKMSLMHGSIRLCCYPLGIHGDKSSPSGQRVGSCLKRSFPGLSGVVGEANRK